MTPTRYYIERFAQTFGYNRKVQRLGDAASEMHLLREAEAQLGAAIWKNVEPIESLSDDYWNLRKRIRACEQIQEKLAEAEGSTEKSQQSVIQNTNPATNEQLQLSEEREKLLNHQKQLVAQREQIIQEGEEVRRIHKGLTTKLEVLIDEGETEIEVDKLSARLNELKERFMELKKLNHSITQEITEGDTTLNALNEQIKALKNQDDMVATESMRASSQESKELWALRAELASLNRQIYQHYTVIGRHVSRNASNNTDCAKAVKSHRGLVDVMKALRKSIALNHRLAGAQMPN